MQQMEATMDDDERNNLLDNADSYLAQALSDLSLAHTMALEAEAEELSAGIHHAMTMLEGMLGFVPAPQSTHATTAVPQ